MVLDHVLLYCHFSNPHRRICYCLLAVYTKLDGLYWWLCGPGGQIQLCKLACVLVMCVCIDVHRCTFSTLSLKHRWHVSLLSSTTTDRVHVYQHGRTSSVHQCAEEVAVLRRQVDITESLLFHGGRTPRNPSRLLSSTRPKSTCWTSDSSAPIPHHVR